MQADLYQRELRLQEDEIYRLEDYIEEYQSIIRGYRCEVEELKQQLADRRDRPAVAPPKSDFSTPERVDTGPSLLETPEPADLESLDVETLPDGSDEAPPFNPNAAEEPTGEPSLDAAPLFQGASTSGVANPPLRFREPAPLRQASATAVVSSGPPNPYPASASDRALEPTPEAVGDPSITLSVEVAEGAAMPTIIAIIGESERGSLGGFHGEASVMITDPTADGRFRRVARWDFSSEEVEQSRRVSDGRIALPIALPAETPTDRPLRLWVRLVEPDGRRRLQAAPVEFDGEIGRLASRHVTGVRRLPDAAGSTELVSAKAEEESTWRPASLGGAASRFDPAVAPAAYEETW